MTGADRAGVALIGTGRMGAAMAGRLSDAGFPLALFNRTRAKADRVAAELAGPATVYDTAAAAAHWADVVLVSLADDAAVTAAYRGDAGVAGGVRPGTVVLEMSTLAPATVRALAPLVTGRGGTLIDAPVSGSVATVQQGQLTVLAAGDPAALDRARPALETFAKKIFHLGELGAGATMKLAVNSIVHGLNQVLAEALVLAEKAGVARAAAYEVFANSAAAAPYVQYKQEAFLHPDQAPVAFSLDLVAKDLDLIQTLAAESGARMDLTAATRAVVEAAVADGLGDHDLSAVAELLRRPN